MKMRYIIRKIETNKNAHEIFRGFCESGFSMFLDSSLYVEDTGRYSIIVFNPFLTITSTKGIGIELWRRSDNRAEHREGDVITLLKGLYDVCKFDYDGELPFIGGFAGYISYDFREGSYRPETGAMDDLHVPDMMLGLYDNVIITDNKYGHVYIAVTGILADDLAESEYSSDDLEASDGSPAGLAELECRAEEIEAAISEVSEYHSHASRRDDMNNGDGLKSNMTWETYRTMIGQAREYIRNGDIYQVNLSQRFETVLAEAPFEVYERLRAASPVPFAAYLDFVDFKILSSSMERYMKIRDGIAETRPIKGTRPRGRTPGEDALNADELLSSAKDRAEHVMIVDLERNDLGRFCEFGSVRVEKLLDLEPHSNVFHLVSTVTGRIKPDAHIIDCIMSAFPGGSITGAPKIRSMEIIDELEPVKRGVYTGSIGYIGFNAVCDFNIAIRTIAIKGNRAYYHVGGGIVWDSSAEGEYAETMDKGSGMMRALYGRRHVIVK